MQTLLNVECEQMWEVLDLALDSVLEVHGFFPSPP